MHYNNGMNDENERGEEYPLSSQRKLDRLERFAVLQRWPIPAEFRDGIVRRQCEIATGEDAREATAAARALIAMERINQIDDERMSGMTPLD